MYSSLQVHGEYRGRGMGTEVIGGPAHVLGRRNIPAAHPGASATALSAAITAVTRTPSNQLDGASPVLERAVRPTSLLSPRSLLGRAREPESSPGGREQDLRSGKTILAPIFCAPAKMNPARSGLACLDRLRLGQQALPAQDSPWASVCLSRGMTYATNLNHEPQSISFTL